MKTYPILALALLFACNDGSTGTDDKPPTDGDADTDTDTDTDSDADTDTDTDTDADTDPVCPELSLPAVPGVEYGTTVGFGDDFAESCGGAGLSDLFVEVPIPADGRYVFTVDSPDFEPVITLFDSCGGSAMGCGPTVEADLVGGTTVVALIDGASGVDGGFALSVFEGGQAIPEAHCTDTFDNDLDGLYDCDDIDCSADPTCLPACADVGFVGAPGSYSGSTVGAGDDEACIDEGAPDVAVAWTAPADGVYRFVLDEDGTTFDASLGLRLTGCIPGTFYCTNSPEGGGEDWVVDLVEGQTILLVVDGVAGSEGDFELVAEVVPETETDCVDGLDEDFDGDTDCEDADCDLVCFEDCVNGVDDDGDGLQDCQDTTCAADPACAVTCPNEVIVDQLSSTTTAQPNGASSSCGGAAAPDRTVAFTAPADGTYRFALTTTGTQFDSVLTLLDACGGTEIDCVDAWSPTSPNGGEELLVDLVADQTVIAVVDGWSANAFGDFELIVHLVTESETACADGLDNDLDEATDCADPECEADLACADTITVTWSNVAFEVGCFTFSSPTALGSSAYWSDDGVVASLDFTQPTWDAVFTGSWTGSDITLTSVSLFPYGAGQWQTTETMTGTLNGSTVSGTYLYTECDFTFNPASCPADGGCEVTADFSFEIP